ncbi:hypothetical protein [Ponticaulis profundi]|uniref:VWFA domain-containing protein n=1 Tax=Ponticaulis profundi TaxID=2665222 RepID=A0ABW1S5C3_9PROT
MDTTISRRGLLASSLKLGISGVVLGSFSPLLGACQKSPELPAGGDKFDIWREMQSLLRTSPDHTLSRARALVSAGDLDAIHKFVRDEIRLVSAEGFRFTFGANRKFGKRAALRAGAGTAREKAEILTDLLNQAGANAEMVDIFRPTGEQAESYVYRAFSQPFEPDIPDGQVENWMTRLEMPELPPNADLDLEAKSKATAQALKSLLSEDQKNGIGRSEYRNQTYGDLTVVRITQEDGSYLLADPIRPDMDLMPWPEDLRAKKARQSSDTLPVTLTLTAITNESLDEPFEIAKAEWDADKVAGRQVQIGFDPLGDTETTLVSRIGDIRSFTPVLKVQALDGEELTPEKSIVLGTTVTLEGDRIELDEEGGVLINGDKVASREASGFAGKVASVEIEPDASRFPTMGLKVYPRNADGALVEGLTSGDFAIADQTEAASHLLTSSETAPRILFLADNSLSMPKEYRGGGQHRADGPKMVELYDKVKAYAESVHPNATVKIRSTNSSLWSHLIRASAENYSLIVYATDGDLNGRKPTDSDLKLLANGPKGIILNVNNRTMEETRARSGAENLFDQMARATNGTAISVAENGTADIESAIQSMLESGELNSPYKLSYNAPTADKGERTVVLTLGGRQFEATYTVEGALARGRKLAGLQLTVRVGDHSITRTLVGAESPDEVTDEHLNALQGAMFGQHMLAFEGPTPSVSTVLDDLLTSRLSKESLDDLARQDDADLQTMIDELDKGFAVLPEDLYPFLVRSGDLSGEDFATAEQGLRTILYSTHAVMNTDRVVRRIDILPLSYASVLTPDRDKLIDVSFTNSLNLAMLETGLFDQSTHSMLDGKSLSRIDLGQFSDAGLEDEKIDDWRKLNRKIKDMFAYPGHYSFTAEDGQTPAVWSISRTTGEVYGLLPDGSGGGNAAERIERQLKELDQVIAYLNLLVMAAGVAGGLAGFAGAVGAFSLGIVAAYGQRLARLYAAVSMSIILLDSSGIKPAVRKAIAGMACEVKKATVMAIFGGAGKIMSTAVNLFSLAENIQGARGKEFKYGYSCPL